MLRTGMRFLMKTRRNFGFGAWERNLHQHFQDAPHGSAILSEKSTELRRGSGRERNFLQNFQDAPHGSAILNEEIDGNFRTVRTGAQFLIRG